MHAVNSCWCLHAQATELDGSSAVPGMLPVGQPCPAQASLASLAPCDIMLHDISVEAPQNTGEAPGVKPHLIKTVLAGGGGVGFLCVLPAAAVSALRGEIGGLDTDAHDTREEKTAGRH